MWPWEHLMVGYLLYSLATRVLTGETPRGAAAVAVALGTQFPDLVDKPLAWSLAILESGISVAHSVFVATALSAVAVLLARRFGRQDVGAAFAVGYLSHIPADVVYPVVLGGSIDVTSFFWPLGETSSAARAGFLDNFGFYLLRFVDFLGTPRGTAFLVLEVVLVGLTTWLWVADGCPGIPRLGRTRSPLGNS